VINTLAAELSLGEQAEATELLHTYQDVFSKSKNDLGRTLMTKHRINTGDARLVFILSYLQTSLPIIDTFTENMERQHSLGVAQSFTTSFQARTNSSCERSHATVNSMLAKCVSTNQRDGPTTTNSILF